VSLAATGQFKGGRPTGKWFLAATLVDGNTSVRAWNTHHKGMLFSRVFHPSWTDSCDGKERFQSASSGTTWSATVCEIEPTQVRDRFVLERGCIPLHIQRPSEGCPRKTPKILACGPPGPPFAGGPAAPWTPSLGRCAFRLQRAFTEKMFTKTSLPCGRSGSKFAGQDGGSKGGTQTIFKGDTNGSEKQAMHCSCSRRCP
jgi:hypothetical protein